MGAQPVALRIHTNEDLSCRLALSLHNPAFVQIPRIEPHTTHSRETGHSKCTFIVASPRCLF